MTGEVQGGLRLPTLLIEGQQGIEGIEQEGRAGNGVEGINGIATGAVVQHEDGQVMGMSQVAELAQQGQQAFGRGVGGKQVGEGLQHEQAGVGMVL
jgi:hypothetical protein